MMAIRYVQRLAVVFVLLTCTTLLYLNQSSSWSHHLPQKVAVHHYTKIPREYSVKPLAYIFPQYYTFPDNDRLHGKNFTEWVNVKKVAKNRFGLETIRPHESIGFYNGSTHETRHRYGKFLKDYGFHGAVFHHYWFAGRPVMEHVIEEMLKDGEPDIPFMLSWANEPWSKRWDGSGASGGLLIAQDYGLHVDWRKHFDWLLPFFRHPKYIRSEGRIQFVVYNPTHVGSLGPHMFAAFRQWAVEEGLGGMDIIETRWGPGGSDSWWGHPPDAINEFHPHVDGRDPAKYSATARMSRVYHRGTLACWDTTPRHPTDGSDVVEPFCHPKTWQWHLVEMLRKIKSEPNPIGAENFFFVNALNEWGEGNCIESSKQFGDGYGIAMKNALEISEREHVWYDTQNEDAMVRNLEVGPLINQTADVCVIVRTTQENADDKVFKLTAMLRSLVAQTNENWKAVVVQTNKDEFRGLDQLVVKSLDPRVRRVQVPEGADSVLEGDDNLVKTTDWLIKNMTDADAGCAAARYLLVADAGDRFEPNAFSAILDAKSDIVGLNVESRKTLWNHAQLQNSTWNDTCSRLAKPDLVLWNTSLPTDENFDLSATFFNFTKFRSETHTFSKYTTDFPHDQGSALASYLTSQRNWTFSATNDKFLHVYHNPSYSACNKTGNFWFDSPIFEEQGCYTSERFFQVYGGRGDHLKDFDLQYFRENGFCVRYKQKSYNDALKPKVKPKPEPVEKLVEDDKPTSIEEKEPDATSNAENKQETNVAAATKPPPKVELKKDDDESEAAKEFAPGSAAPVDTSSSLSSSSYSSSSSSEETLPTPTSPSPAKLTGNDGGGVR